MTPGIRWQRGGRSAPPAPQLPGSAGSVDLLGPHALQVHSGHLGLGDGVCRTLAITGFPREVGPGWLQPLLEHPGRFDVALHVEPVPTAVATTGCAGSSPAWSPPAGQIWPKAGWSIRSSTRQPATPTT